MSDIFTRNKRIKRKRAEFSARFIFTSYNIHDKIIVTIDKVINIMKLTLMYFSPTHTTKKTVSAVGKVFFEKMLCETRVADLTSLAGRMREYSFAAEDVLIIGVPVYGGRIPQLLHSFLKGIKGNGARAVILTVYGNRDYDDALLELYDFMTQQNFVVCAAGAFIGQHSYSEKVGAGRPDVEDLLAAGTFGLAAYEKVVSGKPVAKKIRGKRPYKEYSPSMLKLRQAPSEDSAKCIRCGKCIEVCPVCNLDAKRHDSGRCIGCAACVRFCPVGARRLNDENTVKAKKWLEENCLARRTPEFFI